MRAFLVLLRQMICIHGPYHAKPPMLGLGYDFYCQRCGKLCWRERPG